LTHEWRANSLGVACAAAMARKLKPIWSWPWKSNRIRKWPATAAFTSTAAVNLIKLVVNLERLGIRVRENAPNGENLHWLLVLPLRDAGFDMRVGIEPEKKFERPERLDKKG
jgi:hypothetical protein